MYSIKILNEAVSAIIELADSCTSEKPSTCCDVYHVVKYVRASVRDFPEKAAELDEMYDILNAQAARLRRMAGGKITEHIIVNENGEIFPLPLSNSCGALAHLIRRKLNENDVGNFLHLYKISTLYMHRYFENTDSTVRTSDTDIRYIAESLTDVFFSKIRKYTVRLEMAMNREKVAFSKITV